MRSREDVFRDLEEDRGSREAEIRLIQNRARTTEDSDERAMFFRVCVLLTYAHLEGFCKFALNNYVSAVNAFKIRCGDASVAIFAASLKRVFAALRNPESKHDVFRNLAPDDTKLHLLARERRFVEEFGVLSSQTVSLSEEVVDAEHNLSSLVLKKNLFRLDIPYEPLDTCKGELDKLLGVRNAIAHGDRIKAPSQKETEEYVNTAFDVMRFVQEQILEALTTERYRKAPTASATGVVAPATGASA